MTMPDGTGSQGPAGQYPAEPAPPPPSYTPPGPTGYESPPPGPPAAEYPPAPPPKRSRSGLRALVVLVVLIVLIVGGLKIFGDRISGDVNALSVGDCIDEPSSTTSIKEVQHQPCNEPHDGEVFAVLQYPGANGAAYPGASAFDTYVREQCLPAVHTYTGRTLAEIDAAGLSYAYFYPTTSSWSSNNDRGVTCYLDRSDGQKMTGSVKAATHS